MSTVGTLSPPPSTPVLDRTVSSLLCPLAPAKKRKAIEEEKEEWRGNDDDFVDMKVCASSASFAVKLFESEFYKKAPAIATGTIAMQDKVMRLEPDKVPISSIMQRAEEYAKDMRNLEKLAADASRSLEELVEAAKRVKDSESA